MDFSFNLSSIQDLLEISGLGLACVELVDFLCRKISGIRDQKPGTDDKEYAETCPDESSPDSQVACVDIVHTVLVSFCVSSL